jgi:hypothetical protein
MQPDVRAAAADFVGGFGEELAHGGSQVAQVGQRGGGSHELGQLSEAGSLGLVAGGLLLAEFGELQHGRGVRLRRPLRFVERAGGRWY